VTQQFIDAGYTPLTQSVVLTATGNDMPNVYAELPGTQCSDRVLVVGAHYDSTTAQNPAADDNASGVAGLFELARALRDHPLPITVRFVAFSYEEDGLVGSFAMVQRDLAEHNDIIGALSLEMIGFTTTGTDALTGLPPTFLAMVADPASAPMARAFGAAAYTYNPSFPALSAVIDPAVLPDIYRSDHAAYALNGIPGLMATDTANFRNPNYHTVSDTVATIDWGFLAESARTALAGVAVYGSSDQDLDGTADICRPTAPPTTPPAPASTLPGTGGTGGAPPAPVAQPVAAEARYTG
jgi:Zn-dependent M28 family amino/carboxypeptidase